MGVWCQIGFQIWGISWSHFFISLIRRLISLRQALTYYYPGLKVMFWLDLESSKISKISKSEIYAIQGENPQRRKFPRSQRGISPRSFSLGPTPSGFRNSPILSLQNRPPCLVLAVFSARSGLWHVVTREIV